MEEFYTDAITRAIHHFDFDTALNLAQLLVDHTRISPTHIGIQVPAYIQLSRVYIHQGEHQRALLVLNEIPQAEEVLYLKSLCHLQTKDYEHAEPLLLSLIPALQLLLRQYDQWLMEVRHNDGQGTIPSVTYPELSYNIVTIKTLFQPLLAHAYRLQGTVSRRLGKALIACDCFKSSLDNDSTIWSSFQASCELRSPYITPETIPQLVFNSKHHRSDFTTLAGKKSKPPATLQKCQFNSAQIEDASMLEQRSSDIGRDNKLGLHNTQKRKLSSVHFDRLIPSNTTHTIGLSNELQYSHSSSFSTSTNGHVKSHTEAPQLSEQIALVLHPIPTTIAVQTARQPQQYSSGGPHTRRMFMDPHNLDVGIDSTINDHKQDCDDYYTCGCDQKEEIATEDHVVVDDSLSDDGPTFCTTTLPQQTPAKIQPSALPDKHRLLKGLNTIQSSKPNNHSPPHQNPKTSQLCKAIPSFGFDESVVVSSIGFDITPIGNSVAAPIPKPPHKGTPPNTNHDASAFASDESIKRQQTGECEARGHFQTHHGPPKSPLPTQDTPIRHSTHFECGGHVVVNVCLREGISNAYAALYPKPFKFFPPHQHHDLAILQQLKTIIPTSVATISSSQRELMSPPRRVVPTNHHSSSGNTQGIHKYTYNAVLTTPQHLEFELLCHLNYLHLLCTTYLYTIQNDFIKGYHNLHIISSYVPPRHSDPSIIPSEPYSESTLHDVTPSFNLLPYTNLPTTTLYLSMKGLLLTNINETNLAIETFRQLHNSAKWYVAGMDIFSSQLHLTNDKVSLSLLSAHFNSIAPRCYETLIILANHYSLQEQGDGCLRALVLSTTINNNNVNNNCNHSNLDKSYPHVLLGYEYQDNNEIKKAIFSFQRALFIDPFNYKALFALGNIQLSQDLHENAISYFKRSIQANCYLSHVYITLTQVYNAVGMIQSAKELLFTALRINYDISLYIDFKNHDLLNNSTLQMFIDPPNSDLTRANHTSHNNHPFQLQSKPNHTFKQEAQVDKKRGFFNHTMSSSLAKRGKMGTTWDTLEDGASETGGDGGFGPKKQFINQSSQPSLGSELGLCRNSQDSEQTSQPINLRVPSVLNQQKSQQGGVPNQFCSLSLVQTRTILSHIFFYKSCHHQIAQRPNDKLHLSITKMLYNSNHDQFITKLSILISQQHFITHRILHILFLYITQHCEEIFNNLSIAQKSIDDYDINATSSLISNNLSTLYQQTKQNFIEQRYKSEVILLLSELYHSISFIQLLMFIQTQEVNFYYIIAKLHLIIHACQNWYTNLALAFPQYSLTPSLYHIHLTKYEQYISTSSTTAQTTPNNNKKSGFRNEFVTPPPTTFSPLDIFNKPLYYINHEQLALNYITYAIALGQQELLQLQSTQQFPSLIKSGGGVASLVDFDFSLMNPNGLSSTTPSSIVWAPPDFESPQQLQQNPLLQHHHLVSSTPVQDPSSPTELSSGSTSTLSLSHIGQTYLQLQAQVLKFHNDNATSNKGPIGTAFGLPLLPHANALYNSTIGRRHNILQGFSHLDDPTSASLFNTMLLPYAISANNNNINSSEGHSTYNVICMNPQQQAKNFTYSNRLYKLVEYINQHSIRDLAQFGLLME